MALQGAWEDGIARLRHGMRISPRDRRLGFWGWALSQFLRSPVAHGTIRRVGKPADATEAQRTASLAEFERQMAGALKVSARIWPSLLTLGLMVQAGLGLGLGRLLARMGGARLELDAVAESAGSAGQTVRVRNPATGKVFEARVEGKGRVSAGRGDS